MSFSENRNQGLVLIVNREIVESYRSGDRIEVDFVQGIIKLNDIVFEIAELPKKLMEIIKKKGLINWIKEKH